jgi:hypothetical protein
MIAFQRRHHHVSLSNLYHQPYSNAIAIAACILPPTKQWLVVHSVSKALLSVAQPLTQVHTLMESVSSNSVVGFKYRALTFDICSIRQFFRL